MPDIYIAGSLIHTTKGYWKFYERIGEVVKRLGLEPYIPHIHTAEGKDPHGEEGAPNEVDPVHAYTKNIAVINNVKCIIAEVTTPGMGVGLELGVALQLKKKIICLAKEGAKVSRMIRGPWKIGLLELVRYKNEEDALRQIKTLFETKFKSLT